MTRAVSCGHLAQKVPTEADTTGSRASSRIGFQLVASHGHTYIDIYIYVCVYICMYLYMHACIHTYIHTFIHSYPHTFIHTHIHTCMHACMCISTYVYIYIHMCMCNTGTFGTERGFRAWSGCFVTSALLRPGRAIRP